MSEMDLQLRMNQFESRLFRLEEVLGLIPPPTPRKQQIVQQPWPLVEEPEPEFAEVCADPLEKDGPSQGVELEPVLPYELPTPPAPIRQTHLEQTIGLKWAGWIGAVVLVIGAAFGVKFAWEQGWFSIATPAVRLGLLAVSAVACLAAGEWVYRKVNQVSAAGLFGAGVAIFFVISYAGHAYYSLYAQNTAFVFMGVSTIVGAAVARRGRQVSIAVLSLIGGNLAPLLLHEGHPLLFGFFSYLMMLQIVALSLAAMGGEPRWWTLRGFSLTTMAMWFPAIANLSPWQTTFAFVTVFALLYQGELIWSAIRSRLGKAQAGATFSLLVTTAFIIASLQLLSDSATAIRVACVLTTAAVVGTFGLFCRRSGGQNESRRALGISFALQTIALIVLAVPVALSGIWIAFAWAGLAISFVVLGRTLDLTIARRSAIGVWMLAAIDLAIWSIGTGVQAAHASSIGISIAGNAIPAFTLMGWALSAAGQLIARLLLPSKTVAEKREAQFVSAMSGLLFMIVSIAGLSTSTATLVLLVYAFILAAGDSFEINLGLHIQSTVIMVIAAMKWMLFDTLYCRLTSSFAITSVPGPAMMSGTVVALALAGLYVWASHWITANRLQGWVRKTIAGLLVAVVFWLGSFGIDQIFMNLRFSASPVFSDPGHAEQVALSIFWSAFALGAIAVGFGRRTAGLRYVGLTLFAVTLLKVVTIDLSQVSTGYRILSFMGLGVLLLLTSVVYGKLNPILLNPDKKRDAADCDQMPQP